jgi:deoxyribodipyrimidine photolyase
VFAVFLYEPEILSQPEWSSSHTEFQAECLRDLEPSLGRLGIRLVTRRGEAVAMLERLAQETGFRVLIAHEEMGRARPRPKVHASLGQWRRRALAV